MKISKKNMAAESLINAHLGIDEGHVDPVIQLFRPPLKKGPCERSCLALVRTSQTSLFSSNTSLHRFDLCASFLKMSGHDNEDLIDYEDEHDIVTNGAITSSATNGGIATGVGDVDGDKDKKNFSGIHSTGFRFV